MYIENKFLNNIYGELTKYKSQLSPFNNEFSYEEKINLPLERFKDIQICIKVK